MALHLRYIRNPGNFRHVFSGRTSGHNGGIGATTLG